MAGVSGAPLGINQQILEIFEDSDSEGEFEDYEDDDEGLDNEREWVVADKVTGVPEGEWVFSICRILQILSSLCLIKVATRSPQGCRLYLVTINNQSKKNTTKSGIKNKKNKE